LLIGNVLGYVRVAITAYLLGTHSAADCLAVAIGPLDALNAVLAQTMIFAFVPMLTERRKAERTALFFQLNRIFFWLFTLLSAAIALLAPWLIPLLAPGLDPAYKPTAVLLLRIAGVSSLAAGAAAIYAALLYTDRRFAPTAFYQALLNVFTIVSAVGLWRVIGIYAFAIGYAAGAWAQFAIVRYYARSGLETKSLPDRAVHWRALLAKPASIL